MLWRETTFASLIAGEKDDDPFDMGPVNDKVGCRMSAKKGRIEMNSRHFLNPERVRNTKKDRPDAPACASKRGGASRPAMGAVALAVGLAALSVPSWAQTADDLAKQYKMETMEQALQTKERYDLYGLHFATDQSTIPADAKSFLDDIAAALKNFPDWHLRIVGHTDATADPEPNEVLSFERANAVQGGVGRARHR